MLYLLLAVALCLLVPWLPVLMYGRMPRLPEPPVTERQLRQLAGELRPDAPEAAVEGDAPTDITPAKSPLPASASDEPRPEGGPTALATAVPPRRLSMGPYRWVNVVAVPAFVLTMLALGVGWAFLLHVLGEAHSRSFGPAVFLFKPFAYGLICVLPAMFLGIFTTLPVLTLLARLLLGRRRFREYLFWDEGRLASGGVRAEGVVRLLTGLALLTGALGAVFVVLVMNWYARFTADEIAIKRLLAVREEVRPYASVERLVLTTHMKQNNEIVERENIHIRFADGKAWDTDATFMLPRDDAERQRFLDFLRAKTGKAILQARLIDDVPGW